MQYLKSKFVVGSTTSEAQKNFLQHYDEIDWKDDGCQTTPPPSGQTDPEPSR